MNRKFKVGDRVQLTKEHVEWLCKWSAEGYACGANFSLRMDQYRDLAVLYLSREFDCPLRGTVIGDNGARNEYFAYRVEFKNKFGIYGSSFYEEENLKRLKSFKRCKTCGSKRIKT